MSKFLSVSVLLIVLIGGGVYVTRVLPGAFAQEKPYVPEKGFVPDQETAIAIAVAVWKPIYGKEDIESEKPFKARLKNETWVVEGSMPKGWAAGGTAIAEIAKKDGRILTVTHGK